MLYRWCFLALRQWFTLAGRGLKRSIPTRLWKLFLQWEDFMADYTFAEIAKMIDHSLLQPMLTDRELEEGCRLAHEYHATLVCIQPYAGPQPAAVLRGAAGRVATTICF